MRALKLMHEDKRKCDQDASLAAATHLPSGMSAWPVWAFKRDRYYKEREECSQEKILPAACAAGDAAEFILLGSDTVQVCTGACAALWFHNRIVDPDGSISLFSQYRVKMLMPSLVNSHISHIPHIAQVPLIAQRSQ